MSEKDSVEKFLENPTAEQFAVLVRETRAFLVAVATAILGDRLQAEEVVGGVLHEFLRKSSEPEELRIFRLEQLMAAVACEAWGKVLPAIRASVDAERLDPVEALKFRDREEVAKLLPETPWEVIDQADLYLNDLVLDTFGVWFFEMVGRRG